MKNLLVLSGLLLSGFGLWAQALTVSINTKEPVSIPDGLAEIQVDVTGGTPPYTGAGTRYLPAGMQTITVSDNAGASSSSSYFVCPAGPAITGPTALCAGGQAAILNSNRQTNWAQQFPEGSGSYINVPHSSSINLGATFTLEAWVNYSGSDVTIVDKGDYDFLWQLNKTGSDKKMGFSNKKTAWVFSTGTVPENVWTHVAVTLGGGTLTFYINGQASGTAAVTFAQDNQPMNIGRQQPTFCKCNFFNGQMDELRLWNVTRTAAEVQAGMNIPVANNSAGLAAYYKFDETNGATTPDATPNGNNGTFENGFVRVVVGTWQWMPINSNSPNITVSTAGTFTTKSINAYGCQTTSKFYLTALPATVVTASGSTTLCQGQSVTLKGSHDANRALSFSKASSQYITVPHSASINLGASFTMEAWVNYSGSDVTIIDKGDYDFLWQLNKTGSGRKMGFQNKKIGPWVYSVGTVPENVWTHVAITLDAGILTFFINGWPAGNAPVIFSQDTGPMTIGRQQPASCQCNHFNGTMDELRIWNIARTPAEILGNRYAPVDKASPGLAAYYKFDEASGSTAVDATSNGNNGMLMNNPVRQSPATSPFISLVSTLWVPGGETTPAITVTTQNTYSGSFTNNYGCTNDYSQTVNTLAMPPPALWRDSTVLIDCYGSTTNLLNLTPFQNNVFVDWNTNEDLNFAPRGEYQAIGSSSSGCVDTVNVHVKLDQATWVGSLSNEWGNPGNWSSGKVPTSLTHVIIPGNTTNPCFVGTANATAASIQVRNGGILRAINNWYITVNGTCAELPPN